MAFDLSALLAPGGHAREFMRAAPNGGDWVDGFCNEILASIAGPAQPVAQLSDAEAGAVEALLAHPKMSCTSINVSRLPDASCRITMLRAGGKEWLKGYGETFSAAVAALQKEIDLNT